MPGDDVGTKEGAGRRRLEEAVRRPWPEWGWRAAVTVLVGVDGDGSGDNGGGGHRVVVGESVQDLGMTSGCPLWRMARSRSSGSTSGGTDKAGSTLPQEKRCLGHSSGSRALQRGETAPTKCQARNRAGSLAALDL